VRRQAFLLTLQVLLLGSPAGAQGPPAPLPTQEVQEVPDPQGEEVLRARPVTPPPAAPTVPPVGDPMFRRGGSDYKVGRQDLLEIKVFDLEELNQTVRVADDGSITVPLLGRLQVAGLTKGELEGLIARLLEERFVRDPQVTIFVKEYESKKVAVSGAVKKPGTYEMLGEKTLLEMISQAGGLDAEPGKQIFIFRQQGEDGKAAERLAVDLDRLVYRAESALNVALFPGDIVYVPAVEKVRIFVSGAVKNPNLYEVPRDEPVTVLKAVTLAGGTTDRAAEKKVQVIRTRPDGTRVILPVDLRRVKRGKSEDPVLERDDLVLVPEAFF
jgi:polysaccharide export outer membrane protein